MWTGLVRPDGSKKQETDENRDLKLTMRMWKHIIKYVKILFKKGELFVYKEV